MINFGLKVVLVPIDQVPSEKMREWRNDYTIWRWCRQNDLLLQSAHSEWVDSVMGYDGEHRMYGIHWPEESRLAGVCGLTNIDWVNRRAEFSLYIEPTCQHEGLGKDALKTLTSHGFYNLGLESIWGESYEHNPAIKMFQALGFGLDGIRRNFYYREGAFINAHLYSILKKEWETLSTFNDARTQVCPSI